MFKDGLGHKAISLGLFHPSWKDGKSFSQLQSNKDMDMKYSE